MGKYDNIQNKFLKAFNNSWNAAINHPYFLHENYTKGNRLRPFIVFGGYLASLPLIEISDDELDKVAQLAVSIELIHKASLILDDMIDNDIARHGNTSFHIVNGNENTIMFALYTISVSFKNVNKIIQNLPKDHILNNVAIKIICDIIEKMSFGELDELNLNKNNKTDSQMIKQIIELETSAIIYSSLQLGYYLGNGNNLHISTIFERIGKECGYIFQVMNDLEPFCNKDQYFIHKGNITTDYISSKKNIAISLLFNIISPYEIEKLNDRALTVEESNNLLIHYFKVYKIKDTFIREVEAIHSDIINQIISLKSYSVNPEWCKLSIKFVNQIVKECKLRI